MIRSLRGWASLWIVLAMGAGVLAAWLWMSSTQAWRDHLARAAQAGHDLAATVLLGAPLPEDMRLVSLGRADQPPRHCRGGDAAVGAHHLAGFSPARPGRRGPRRRH